MVTDDGREKPVTVGPKASVDGEVAERLAADGGIERGLNFGCAFSCDAEGL